MGDKGLKCISMWQPWAQLAVIARKLIETRPRNTEHRGELLIHAAKKPITFDHTQDVTLSVLHNICVETFGADYRETLALGAVIGTVNIARTRSVKMVDFDCSYAAPFEAFLGDYREGRFAWFLEQARAFRKPVPFAGKQGFFYVPRNLVRELAQ